MPISVYCPDGARSPLLGCETGALICTMTEREIFVAAMEKADPVGRAAFLARACGNDTHLRDSVEALLREHAGLGNFLDDLPNGRVDSPTPSKSGERAGTIIG